MKTIARDYGANLLFARPAERDRLNQLLGLHIERAGTFLRHRLPPGALFVSGSLARGEPAAGPDARGHLRLHSDIDFVYCGPASPADIAAAETELRSTFGDFDDTLYAFRPAQVPRLHSASARDLALGMRHPVFCDIPVAPPAEFVVDQADGLEVLIYRLAARLAAHVPETGAPLPGLAHRSESQLTAKLAADALRIVATGGGEFARALTFRAVSEERAEPHVRRVAPEDLLREILACREAGTPLPAAVRRQLPGLVRRVFEELVPGRPQGINELLGGLRDTYFPEPTLLHRYALLVAGVSLRDTVDAGNRGDLRFLDQWCREFAGLAAGSPQSALSVIAQLRYPYVLALMATKDAGHRLTAVPRAHRPVCAAS